MDDDWKREKNWLKRGMDEAREGHQEKGVSMIQIQILAHLSW